MRHPITSAAILLVSLAAQSSFAATFCATSAA
jgi:hypothetical protein